jgi:hypothetical protein
MGNSRVMQFRSEFFRPEVTFFNAGGIITRIQDFRAMLERLPPEAQPRFLIIDTETSFFHPNSDRITDRDPMYQLLQRQMEGYTPAVDIYRANWGNVWVDTFQGKIEVSRVASGRGLTTRIGLQALCKEQGFRRDGSYQHGGIENEIENPRHRDYRFADTLRIVRHGEGRFAWGAAVSERAMRELDLLLEYCQAHGIHLIGFMPPHAHAVWEAMQSLGDKYAYMETVKALLQERFVARGFELFDFSDFATLGAPDREAIDGYHGSERTYLRLTIAMIEGGSRLREVTDLPQLRAALASANTISRLRFEGR